MISWINGKLVDKWSINSKEGYLISCGGLGYEIQLCKRNINNKLNSGEEVTLWIHQINRENETILFGFNSRLERDFFRKVILINGIGPQIALTLLDQGSLDEIVNFIHNEDIKNLIKTPGIGERTAIRLITELKGKLNFLKIDNLKKNKSISIFTQKELSEEINTTLLSLRYTQLEIDNVLRNIPLSNCLKNKSKEKLTMNDKEQILDGYVKKAIIYLSHDLSSKGA